MVGLFYLRDDEGNPIQNMVVFSDDDGIDYFFFDERLLAVTCPESGAIFITITEQELMPYVEKFIKDTGDWYKDRIFVSKFKKCYCCQMEHAT